MLQQSSILLTLLVCWSCPRGVTAFGVGGTLPILQDLQTHLPVIHHAASSAFSAPSAQLTDITELSHSISSIQHATNNLLASSVVETDSATNIGNVASSLLADYRKALDADPLKVKIITGCLLAIVGDAIAQSNTPEDYNKKRAVAFVMFDGVWRTVQQVTYGPIIQTCNGKFSTTLFGSLPFLNIQDQLVKEENVILLGAIEQTLVSQLVLIPLLYYPIFYSVTGVVQNLTVEETIQRAKDTFVTLMKRNLLFWIPVQFCAFYFVEENLQIPVLTACGLIWTVILSLSAGNVNTSADEEDTIVDDAFEEKIIAEIGTAKGAIGLPGSSFFSWSAEDDDMQKDSSESPATSRTNTESNKIGKTR